MSRPNLRPLPSPAPRAEVSLAAEAELVRLFDGLLSSAAADEESPDYELLEAAVDGKLDPVAAELLASRLAGDPALQREFDDLVALRDRMSPQPARAGALSPAAFRPRSSTARRWLGFAAAAVLLAALGLELRRDLRRPESATASATARPAAAGRAPEVVFKDSFEGGSTAHWSN